MFISHKKHNEVDMLHGPLAMKIIMFALPLAVSSILQQLFNSADVAVVGRFADAGALAAVGANGEIINLFINLFVGLSVGANVLVAGLIGRGEQERIREAVHTVILIALICGGFLLAAGQVIAVPLLRIVHTPDDIIDRAVIYLRLYFLGAPFIMLYNFGAAVLRARGDSKRPVYALLSAGVLNVILNLFFVIVCRLSVAGVALATMISNMCSSGAVLVFLMKEEAPFTLSLKELRLHKRHASRIIRVGAPAGIQSAVFSFSNIFIQAAVNSFGSSAVAGSAAALNFEFFAYFMIVAFSQSATTFVSQNYAAGKLDRVRRIMRICLIGAAVSCGLISTALVLSRHTVIRVFTTDPAVMEYAFIRMLNVLSFEAMIALYDIPAASLRGMGHSLEPALETILGTCVLRLSWLAFVFRRFHDFSVLFMVYPISWAATTLLIGTTYFLIMRKEARVYS